MSSRSITPARAAFGFAAAPPTRGCAADWQPPGFHAGCMLTSNRGSIRGPMGGMQLPGPRQDVVGWERLLLFRRRARNATDQVDGAPGWGWA